MVSTTGRGGSACLGRPRWIPWLLAAVVAAASGCGSGGSSSSMTWRGKQIEVTTSGSGGVSMSSGEDRAEIAAGSHTVVVQEAQVSLDGTAKPVSAFATVRVEVGASAVTVTVDGRRLFP